VIAEPIDSSMRLLGVAMLERAMKDLLKGSPEERADAYEFLYAEGDLEIEAQREWACNLAKVDIDWVRRRVTEAIKTNTNGEAHGTDRL
jgi:hypothetical protein